MKSPRSNNKGDRRPYNKTTVAVCISRRALKGKKYFFRDTHNFSFSAKIQDGRQKWRKLKFFP